MKRIAPDEQATLILLLAFIFGAWFRLMPAWLAGFPVNDGGMFYTMILNLQANHYALPLFTAYNHLNIPFAYPPLGFYVGAALSDLLRVSPLAIIRWLPGIINALTVPAFYFFAKEILKDKFQSSLATLTFALIPHLTSWLSMGGGLTRSFGMLFMLPTLGYVYRVFESDDRRSLWGAILFGGLTVLSHTEAPIYTIAIALFIWAMKSRSLKGALNGIIIALGVLLIAAPWYGTIIYRHGLTPFLSALHTGGQTIWSVVRLLNINMLTDEFYLGLLGTLGVLGMIFLIVKKQYFIPLMLALIYLAQPRSAHIIGNIPLALAAGIFIAEVLLPAFSGIDEIQRRRGAVIFAIVAAPYLLINSTYQGFTLSQKHVSENERAAMLWIKDNTPKNSQFLTLTGETESMCESSAEWFPALADRTSLNTLQGREWLLGDKFGEFISHKAKIQSCLGEDAGCLTREAAYFGQSFDYVYISIASPTKNCGVADSSERKTRGLVVALEGAKDYSIVYQSAAAVVFRKR